MSNSIKGIQTSEEIYMQYFLDCALAYIITFNPNKRRQYLYKTQDGIAIKTKYKSDQPKELEIYVRKECDI